MRIMRLPAAFALCAILAVAQATAPIPVDDFQEERGKDGDVALFIAERGELFCRTSPKEKGSFAAVGVLTHGRAPFDLEISGQGPFLNQNAHSLAALSLDFGRGGNAWPERTFLGLGCIQKTRGPLPPEWGGGISAKMVMRDNLTTAGAAPQRLHIDPAKYAPADWDGNLWIGLVLHNMGPSRTLRARLVGRQAAAEAPLPELTSAQISAMLASRQKAKLEKALASLERVADSVTSSSAEPDVEPFAAAMAAEWDPGTVRARIKTAIGEMTTAPIKIDRCAKLISTAAGIATGRGPDGVNVLNSVYARWRESGRFGEGIGCIVRTADNLTKIGLNGLASGEVVSDPPRPVRLSAARHEYEGFQIVLSALKSCARNVTVTLDDLRGPGGVVPASGGSVNAVGYVRIFTGQAAEALIPDPLLIGAIPELTPGQNQPVWITIYVPEDTTAGVYQGKVRIQAKGESKALSVPVELTVRDFSIPRQISLRSSFWMFRDQINRYFHLDEVDLDEYFRWIDCALQHRVCPIDVFEGQSAPLLNVSLETTRTVAGVTAVAGEPNLKPDFTKWDKYVDRMVAGGANTIHLGTTHHLGTYFADAHTPVATPAQIGRVVQLLKVLADHARSRGVFGLHYLQLRDETNAPDSLNVYKEVAKQMPDLKLLLTAPSPESKAYLTIPCPVSATFDPAWRDETKARGNEYWWYVCRGPNDPYANLFLYQSAVQHRALFWQTWHYKIDGLLYWGLNFWSWYDKVWPMNAGGVTTRVQPADVREYGTQVDRPGDGFVMYPGTKADQPLSSVRLEVMRDGEEDYEYFVMLDKLIEQAGEQVLDSPVLVRAQTARSNAGALVKDMTKYERDPEKYRSARDAVAQSIEELQKLVHTR